jgi:hypothetical protein
MQFVHTFAPSHHTKNRNRMTTTEQTKAVATEILRQLGGRRFIAFTGAKYFFCDVNWLQFKIGRGAKNSINVVKVTLNGLDLYDVEFLRVRLGKTLSRVLVAKHENVYNDQLTEIFEQETGLYTSL